MEICKRHLNAPPTGGRQIEALWALEWAWQFFLDQSVGIDETNTFQLKFFI